jgi:hypothetical protein
MSLIKKLNENWKPNYVSFADPDHEPGAVEREGEARAAAAGSHFNGTQALLKDVATHFGAKTRSWEKGHNSWDKETWAEVKIPPFKTDKGAELSARISHDPFREGRYVLSITPKHLRAEGPFVDSKELLQKLQTAIQHDWQKATGQKLHVLDIRIPLDSSSRDMYHRAVEVSIGAPDETVPTPKYIRGVESIIQTAQMYL